MTSEAARAIESVLMVAQDPVDPHLLAQLLEVAPAQVEQLCDELRQAYESEERGFVLVKVAGGYRFQSHPDLAAYVERFVLEGQTARLSAAALETLAIVAYKQPLSRAQVSAIRGVSVDGVLRTLQQRGYVTEVGRDPGPGQATLFGTTRELLERLGLDRIEDLPPIAELFPSPEVMEALERGLLADPPGAHSPKAADDEIDAVGVADADAASEPVNRDGADEPVNRWRRSVTDVDDADPEAPTFDIDLVALDHEPPEPEPPAWAVDPAERAERAESVDQPVPGASLARQPDEPPTSS